MKLELIGENWNTIRYKSRIHLPQDTEFTTLDPDPNNQVIRNGQKYCGVKKITLKKGYYYIVGFWADLVGLTTKQEHLKDTISEFHIGSKRLEVFERRVKK